MRSEDVKEGFILRLKDPIKHFYRNSELRILVTKRNNVGYGIRVAGEPYAVPFSDLELDPLYNCPNMKLILELNQ